MAAVFETHDPIVIFVFGEDFRHTLCSKERGAERTTEAAVVDNLVGSTMEHACWSGLGGIFKRIVATHNATGIGYDGGRDEAFRFIDSLKIFSLLAHVADVKSLVIHPASTTHRQMNDAQLEECGVKPNLIRMSVGLEYIDDIIADIEQALEKI